MITTTSVNTPIIISILIRFFKSLKNTPNNKIPKRPIIDSFRFISKCPIISIRVCELIASNSGIMMIPRNKPLNTESDFTNGSVYLKLINSCSVCMGKFAQVLEKKMIPKAIAIIPCKKKGAAGM